MKCTYKPYCASHLLTSALLIAAFFIHSYLVQELMEADLHQIIRSEQLLTDAHFQYFVYQICRGLKYIHSANVSFQDSEPQLMSWYLHRKHAELVNFHM
jgi:serine/threonine protein kinase